jgi:hypothetical protein
MTMRTLLPTRTHLRLTAIIGVALLFLLSASFVHADATAVKSAIEARNLGPASVTESSASIDATFSLKPGYTAQDVSGNALLVMTLLFENYPTAPVYHVTMASEGVPLIRYTVSPVDLDNLYFGTMNNNGFWGSVEYELLPEVPTSSGSSDGGVFAVFIFLFGILASFGFFIVLGVGAIIALWLIFRKKK